MLSLGFAFRFVHKMDSILGYIAKSVMGCGAALVNDARVRSMQGEECLQPPIRRGQLGWSSVMIEVGNKKK